MLLSLLLLLLLLLLIFSSLKVRAIASPNPSHKIRVILTKLFAVTSFKIKVALKQGCTTQISSGPKKNLEAYPRAKIDIFVPIQRVLFSNKQAEWMIFLVLAGQIKCFRGPYVVHPCYNCSKELV